MRQANFSIIVPLFLTVLLFCSTAESQTTPVLQAPGFPAFSAQDTLLPLLSDSLMFAPDTTNKQTGIDTIVLYAADSVWFKFSPRRTVFQGNASLQYRETILQAHEIEINWDTNLVSARGKQDTLFADTLGTIDSTWWVGFPELNDGMQIIVGESMTYDLKSKRGRVIDGDTQFDDGFYHGKTVKRMDKYTYNIQSGHYTTCDADCPHYHFWSRDMKMVIKDKVVAKPVVLYFEQVPVMIIPYAVFSTRSGRHSGLIIPTYGETAGQGRHFRNLGYYWAPNDYFDAKATLDFYERYGILSHGDLNYAKRYIFTGGISGSLINQHRDNKVERRWDLRLNHSHTFNPLTTLRATGYFVSDDSYLRDVSQNRDEWLKREITSSATLSKRWENKPYRTEINLSYRKNLSSGVISQSFPRISFSTDRGRIFPVPEGLESDEESWYHKMFVQYTGNAELRKNVNVNYLDQKSSRLRSGVKHNASWTFSPDPVLYFKLTPSIKYTESWYDEWYEYFQNDDGSVDTVKHSGLPDNFRAMRTFNAGLGISTKMYGLFHPHLLNVEAIRHTLSPSVRLTYYPDFSEPRWDYYDVYEDVLGNKKYYDRFGSPIYGAATKTESRTVSMTIGNLFEYKRIVDEKESKGELCNLSLNTAYNIAADSLKWSDLHTSLRLPELASGGAGWGAVDQLSGLSLQVEAYHSFYDLYTNPTSNAKTTINSTAPGGLRLLSVDMSTSFRVSGGSDKATMTSSDQDTTAQDTTAKESFVLPQMDNRFESAEWHPSPTPWSGSFSFHYGENHRDPANITRNIWEESSLELQFTKNWKVSYSSRFDLKSHEFVSTTISLYRDMHCWEGRLSWNPVGMGKGFYLRVNIKSTQLQDIKIEKSKGISGF